MPARSRALHLEQSGVPERIDPMGVQTRPRHHHSPAGVDDLDHHIPNRIALIFDRRAGVPVCDETRLPSDRERS